MAVGCTVQGENWQRRGQTWAQSLPWRRLRWDRGGNGIAPGWACSNYCCLHVYPGEAWFIVILNQQHNCNYNLN